LVWHETAVVTHHRPVAGALRRRPEGGHPADEVLHVQLPISLVLVSEVVRVPLRVIRVRVRLPILVGFVSFVGHVHVVVGLGVGHGRADLAVARLSVGVVQPSVHIFPAAAVVEPAAEVLPGQHVCPLIFADPGHFLVAHEMHA
jgi:hypothetical protein